jgi:putative ABC transport system substrate-binding protein
MSFMLIVLLCTLASETSAWAMKVMVITSNDTEPYRLVLQGFKQYLDRQGTQADYEVRTIKGEAGRLNPQHMREKDKVDLILSLGSNATELALKDNEGVPVISGMIFRKDEIKKGSMATGVFLEFPLETQFEMIRRLLPDAKTVGVIYNPGENQQRITAAMRVAEKTGLRLDVRKVTVPQDLPGALESLSRSIDVLWAVPDKLVLNPETARNFLLFSYRNLIPFIGLSPEWVKSGALFSMDWDFMDIGQQCGEMALKVARGTPASSIPPVPPRKVLYSLNTKAGRQMKIDISEANIRNAHRLFTGEGDAFQPR